MIIKQGDTTMIKTPLLFLIASTLLAGCGDESSSPSGSGSGSAINPASTPTEFENTIIPEGFNWEMQNSQAVNFKHVSNITQLNGTPLSIAGKYYVEIYSIDENNKTSAAPFLKTISNIHGEASVLLTMLNSWKGIKVKTRINDLVCINTLYKEQIAATQLLGCDVVLELESL
ncbi:hypothetical protein FR932_04040 [Moritella marina ATCC 15381]|uniref:Lipoprotein n=1 Tax=Moritella marina ATCC 15381 TaxID=1202962 RepID=A0A5J6WII9_MORMI|nr:hypothetical protein [Moritella marina]QFI37058.1 hypothetical protein FR932_04040 [Moritella marina ATCC 15381]